MLTSGERDFRFRGAATGLRTLKDGSLVPHCFRNWMSNNSWCTSCCCESTCRSKTPQEGGVKSLYKPVNPAEPNMTEWVLRSYEAKDREKESMDAVEFLKEYTRMCYSFKGCTMCPLYDEDIICSEYIKQFPKETVEVVKEWSEQHKRKTMMDDFLEKFPEALKRFGRYPVVCPHVVGYRFNALCPHHTTVNSTVSQLNDNDCQMCWNRIFEDGVK